ncbi:hypothetical protein BDK51DRAFT_39721 [Blyttiomyces helicus]|uniref:Uncharacterized protein n=1 Tax=Blyttiomyces helicus TaxID=388810 RepID=A0A4P9W850_9FUNG|nr:hypothetical protein BDK51DRAFT_39721 [Blyttiomyces helicus]|eukprot:RKO88691.1 hypothetical protein BDK51DRAFT_39721 [Blyttiomyces helicus]
MYKAAGSGPLLSGSGDCPAWWGGGRPWTASEEGEGCAVTGGEFAGNWSFFFGGYKESLLKTEREIARGERSNRPGVLTRGRVAAHALRGQESSAFLARLALSIGTKGIWAEKYIKENIARLAVEVIKQTWESGCNEIDEGLREMFLSSDTEQQIALVIYDELAQENFDYLYRPESSGSARLGPTPNVGWIARWAALVVTLYAEWKQLVDLGCLGEDEAKRLETRIVTTLKPLVGGMMWAHLGALVSERSDYLLCDLILSSSPTIRAVAAEGLVAVISRHIPLEERTLRNACVMQLLMGEGRIASISIAWETTYRNAPLMCARRHPDKRAVPNGHIGGSSKRFKSMEVSAVLTDILKFVLDNSTMSYDQLSGEAMRYVKKEMLFQEEFGDFVALTGARMSVVRKRITILQPAQMVLWAAGQVQKLVVSKARCSSDDAQRYASMRDERPIGY